MQFEAIELCGIGKGTPCLLKKGHEGPCSESATTHWWYLSFCDPDRPAGTRFLGVAIVPMPDGLEGDVGLAAKAAWYFKCNPGGEVVGHPIPGDISARIPTDYVCRVLSKAEADELAAKLERQVS